MLAADMNLTRTRVSVVDPDGRPCRDVRRCAPPGRCSPSGPISASKGDFSPRAHRAASAVGGSRHRVQHSPAAIVRDDATGRGRGNQAARRLRRVREHGGRRRGRQAERAGSRRTARGNRGACSGACRNLKSSRKSRSSNISAPRTCARMKRTPSPSGKRTDIGAWLHQLWQKHGQEKHLRGIVLIQRRRRQRHALRHAGTGTPMARRRPDPCVRRRRSQQHQVQEGPRPDQARYRAGADLRQVENDHQNGRPSPGLRQGRVRGGERSDRKSQRQEETGEYRGHSASSGSRRRRIMHSEAGGHRAG